MNTQKNAPRNRTARTYSGPKVDTSRLKGVFTTLIPELQHAVATQEYEIPTPIQERCIQPILEGRDIIGCAQTGTGKTAAFSLPLLQHLSQQRKRRQEQGTPRALILVPTRELAAQIGDSIKTYGRYLKINHAVVFGGINQFHQVKLLNRGIDILVATPGRLLDLMGQGYIHLEEVEFFILDEVDRMLDMGFMPDIKKVLIKVPAKRQTMFFSATLADNMRRLAQTIVTDPVEVTISPETPAVERIDQRLLYVDKKNKDALLISLLQNAGMEKTLIFTQMKHVANRVVKKLENAGIRSAVIHGNKSQTARTNALSGFKRGQFKVLVATDVAARGLDVDDITHIINYNLPLEAETYVHRIGRTGRAGSDGFAISFCSTEEKAYLKVIEKLLGERVPVDIDHQYHCDEAQNSQKPAPKNFGRGQSRSGNNRSGGHSKGGNHSRRSGGNQQNRRSKSGYRR